MSDEATKRRSDGGVYHVAHELDEVVFGLPLLTAKELCGALVGRVSAFTFTSSGEARRGWFCESTVCVSLFREAEVIELLAMIAPSLRRFVASSLSTGGN